MIRLELIGQLLFAALIAGSLVYSALALLAVRKYLSVDRLKPGALQEPVSILKPLHGLDLGLESNLETFFTQNYFRKDGSPAFEILFALREPDDPAVTVVRKLQKRYPEIPSRLIITGEPPYPNAKVYSLSKMLEAASYDLVVMSDSDIRVDRDLLHKIAAEFRDPEIGVATCPYRAIAGPSFFSQLEATGMNTDFMAGILVARMLEGMNFAVGPTIVARRRVLEDIGGMDRIKDYLAEDFVLGQFAAEEGHGVILSSYVVEHHIGSSDSFAHNAAHRIRWCRSTRRSRPAGYLGQIFMMPIPLALIATLIWPGWWPILVLVTLVRFGVAFAVTRLVLEAPIRWWIVPLEDIAGFLFWVAGFFGNTIEWRGRRFRLERDGRFTRVG